jgi:hypothetical protein
MKPVMLYTLPRTRGTAILYSCLRPIIKDEPFAEWKLDLDSEESWNKALYKIDDSRAVVKIHGEHIARDARIEQWYESVIADRKYEIFVIERCDRESIFLSHFIANRFGFNLYDEIAPYNFKVNDSDISHMRKLIKLYLKHFPPYGNIISLETLPSDFFNPNIVPKFDQKSHLKYKYIENFNWAMKQITQVLADYKEEWDHKVSTLK